MADFTLHDVKSAPEESRRFLARSEAKFGMVPNLHRVMAEAPGLLEAYQMTHALFQNSSFTSEEMTVVWQCINVENNCYYCVAAHTGIARRMGVDDAVTETLRNETPLPKKHLEALREFTLKVVRDRGVVPKEEVQAFLDAGYTKRQVLEVILGYAQKIMSNYTNHLAETPVDDAFQKFAWKRSETSQ